MKKYYIGFAVLLALVIGCFGYALSQGSAAKADQVTNTAVEQISSKFEPYTYEHSLPATLAEAGVKDVPSTVQYTRLSDTKYEICFDYKTNASGFDAGWAGLFLGGLSGGAQPAIDQGTSSQDYFNPSITSTHKKGTNCQTVNTLGSYGGYQPLDSSSGSNYSSTACADIPIGSKVSGSVTVSSIDTTKKVIYFSPSNQSVFDETTNGQLAPIASKTYSDNTQICDLNKYAKADVSSIKAGDNLIIYMTSPTDTTLSAVDISN